MLGWQYTSIVMGGGCQCAATTTSLVTRGHPMALKYMHAIMAPLVGSPPIIHHGVSIAFHIVHQFCWTLVFIEGYTNALLRSIGSLVVLCFVEWRPNNERLMELACDGGRSHALLSSTNVCSMTFVYNFISKLATILWKMFSEKHETHSMIKNLESGS